MTTPGRGGDVMVTGQQDAGTLAQILLKLADIGTDVAVIKSELRAVPDHEARIRDLERVAAEGGGRADAWARVLAVLAAVAAAVAAWAAFVHH